MRCYSSLLIVAFIPVFLTTPSINAQKHQAQQKPVLASYGKLPLSFESNNGQTDSSAQFLSHGRGYTLLLSPDRAVIALAGADSTSRHKTVIGITLESANPHAAASPEDQQITRTNYILGNDPSRWHTNIPNFGRIRFRSVYHGIDLLYYGHQDRLEHDFVLAPHADPAQIVLTVAGAEHLTIDPATGDLVLATEQGQPSLRLLKPFTYQQQADHAGSRRIPIDSSYRLLGENRVAFTIGRYNHAQPLIVDPVLVYSTYLGGSGEDQGNGIAVDSAGDAYVVGTTSPANFPVTTGSFQTQDNAANGAATVFISKLNPSGTSLVYSTYLGGSGGDYGYGIALDAANNAYVTGATYSTDFPVTCTAFLATNPSKTTGAPTGFVAELSANGDALTYSTYLGGSGNQSSSPAEGDVSQAIALDATGNAYVTGYTYSVDFPVSDSAFQSKFAGTASIPNAFAAKLSPGGTTLIYATYLGGSGVSGAFYYPDGGPNPGDYGNAIAVDGSGDAYITGSTTSPDFPVTASAFQDSLLGPTNAFVTELNPAGSVEVYSTYLGGSGQQTAYGDSYSPPSTGDTATAIAVDSSGNTYVAGTTTSSNFPVTAGVLEGAADFDSSAGFVTKLNAGGSTLAYSTYLEGVGTSISGLAVDGSGTAYVTGIAPAISAGAPGGFQMTPDALPAPSSNVNSPFVVKLNPSATQLNYATLLGGSSNDGATALALDAAGNVYITGNASSADFPVTAGAFQTTNKAATAGGNAFLSAFSLASETSQTTYPALPTGIATSMTGSGQITVEFCNVAGTSSDSFVFGGTVTLTAAAAGPPLTGIVVFSDNFNYTAPYNVRQIQFYNGWGPGSGSAEFGFGDGEGMDGPSGPFTVDWTVSYSGDAVYAPSSFSGTTYSPGCPAPSSSARTVKPVIRGPHIQLLSPGAGSSSATSGHLVNPQISTSTSGASSQIFGSHGPKFTPPPANPRQNKEASRPNAASSDQSSASCVAAPQTATPVLAIATGTYTSAQTVAITDATVGAAIYYTTDGTTPTSSSTLYAGSITVSTTETINAIAIAAGYGNSAVASAAYTINPPQAATPSFSPAAGTYTSAQTVTIADATTDATIYYTTDGSMPTTNSRAYSSAITVPATETINAIATATGYVGSTVASATYTINLPQAATPSFSPAAGTYTSAQTVTIADTTTGATIYYTTDGSMPTTNSRVYSSAITVPATETINAIATAPGYAGSPVASAIYTINLPPPAFSVSVNPTSLTISPGQTGTAVISIAPQNGFASATTFSCSGQPSGVTCSFSPASVTPSGEAPATTTLTISASSTANLSRPGKLPGQHLPGPTGPTLAIALAAFGWRRRRSLKLFTLLAAATFGLALFSGCGGSSAPKPVTANISVIATSGAIQQTVPLTVTIQ